MSVERIEDYGDTLKVILKPTKAFPNGGYFYCDSDINTLNLVNNYGWSLHRSGKNIYIVAKSRGSLLSFHREYARSITGSYPAYIDHINGVEIDNTDNNLNSVTNQQNIYNRPSRGYYFQYNNGFQPQIAFNRKLHNPYGVASSELEACILQRKLETDYLESLTGKDDYYMYDFLKDRRNDLDILDLERTKQISAEEATYRHVIRHAKDNAWYYYRYNLESYFRYYRISTPKYSLDTQGFMVHPITGERLCQY